MYLVLSWKKTLYWISLDISKLFCKTLLFTRKKKDKLEEAIFKSPQIQTRSKVFFFRLEKKPERRKKKHFGLFPSASQSSLLPPQRDINFENYTAHEATREKKKGTLVFQGRREKLFYSHRAKPTTDFSFQFEGNRSASFPSPSLFSSPPPPPKNPEMKEVASCPGDDTLQTSAV